MQKSAIARRGGAKCEEGRKGESSICAKVNDERRGKRQRIERKENKGGIVDPWSDAQEAREQCRAEERIGGRGGKVGRLSEALLPVRDMPLDARHLSMRRYKLDLSPVTRPLVVVVRRGKLDLRPVATPLFLASRNRTGGLPVGVRGTEALRKTALVGSSGSGDASSPCGDRRSD